MIKTIIKRDGSEEQFSPEKLNGWGIWAAETLGQRVNWPEVVLNTVAVLPEKVTSTELQNALIQECINHKSWSYNRMAGRLYAVKLTKDAYGSDQHPHIRELHKTMVDKGIMSAEFVNAFTDEEYEQINSMLNHRKDFDYAYYQIQQCVNKYSLRDRVSAKKIYETPQYIFMRVAMRLAMNKANRLTRIKDFYYFFSNNKINIPTPYFTNSGTNKNGFNSCCVYMTKDHAASLAAGDHIAYTMTYSSAGIGSNIITRTIEDPVRGGVIMHQGKLPYYRALAGAIKANLQNGRGGAATTTYFCYDPEVFKLQRLKNPLTVPSKQIRELDYSMAFNTFFVAKAARNEEVALFSYKDAPDVYDAMVSADDSAFEAVYNKAVKENRHHSFANAREILLNALNEGFEAGRHYLTNLTEMNRHTPFKDPIWLSNLCLTGDTEVIVKKHKSSKEIKMNLKDVIESEESLKVKSFNHAKNKAEFKEITNKALMKKQTKVLKITDSETGKFIKCTPEHKVYTENRGYIMAKDLKPDDKLRIG